MILISTASAISLTIPMAIQTTATALIRKKNPIPTMNPIKPASANITTLAEFLDTITTGPNVQRIDIPKEIRATAALLLLLAMKPEALLPPMKPSKPT